MNISFLRPGKARDITLVFLIVLGVLIYRRPDAFTNPQLFAEDGNVYFQQFEQYGFRCLWMPYGGYLHFVPRIVSIFWGILKVNYRCIPICYQATEFVLTLLIALNLWTTSAYVNVKYRVLYATSFLLLPIGSDIFLNLTNINWIMSLYLLNYVFIRYTDKTDKNWLLNMLALLIISLSGPFSTLLAPVIVVAIIVERKSLTIKRMIPLLAILTGGGLQMLCIKDSFFRGGVPGPPESNHLLKVITNNVGELLFLRDGDMFSVFSDNKIIAISLLVFLALVIILIRRYKQIAYSRKYILVAYAAIVFASFIISYWPLESKILITNPRYYFLPMLCLSWIAVLSMKKANLLLMGLYLTFFFFHYRYIRMSLPDKHWREQINEYYQGRKRIIDINPEGWNVTLPPSKN